MCQRANEDATVPVTHAQVVNSVDGGTWGGRRDSDHRNTAARPREIVRLDDVILTVDGYVLVAGRMVGWLREHPAGWTAVVAGAAAIVPPTGTIVETVDKLLRHPERGGPLILEHLSPAAITSLLLPGCVERLPP